MEFVKIHSKQICGTLDLFLLEYECSNTGVWRLTPLSTIFQLYRGGHGSFWLVEETTDLLQVIGNQYHIMMYRVHVARAGF